MKGPGDRRTVVIGGTGFIGRHLCAEFAAAGHQLLVVARDARKNTTGHRFVSLDLAHHSAPAEVAALLRAERPDVVVNAAGAVWSPTDAELHDSNVRAVEHLVAAFSALSSPPRLIHLGSVNEYAPMPQGVAVDENAPLRPVTGYGQSKLSGSLTVLRALARDDMDGMLLRMANVTGPGLPRVSLLGKVAAQLAACPPEGRPDVIRLYTMRAHRDFVDSRDAARAILAAAMAPVSGRVVNIGRGQAVSVRKLVGLLIAASGLSAQIVEDEPHPATRRGPPEAEWLQVDPRTAGELLAWSAFRPLEDSIEELWLDARSRAGAMT
jgi:nucleoside-diphosphate-sugar epimerase